MFKVANRGSRVRRASLAVTRHNPRQPCTSPTEQRSRRRESENRQSSHRELCVDLTNYFKSKKSRIIFCDAPDRYVSHRKLLTSLLCSGEPRQSSRALTSFPVIVVGRTGRGNIVGELSSTGMRPCQSSGQRNPGTGDLSACRVRMTERRGDGNGGGAEPSDGDDNRRFRIRATVNGDGLALAKAVRTGNRDNGRAHIGASAHRGCTRRANCRDDGALKVCASVNHDLLACIEALHAVDFDIGSAGG